MTEIPDASAAPTTSANLVYGLDDPILWPRATVIAFQHLLAMFVGTITPATIVAGALDLRRLQKAFSPVVAGTVVRLIGLLLVPTSLSGVPTPLSAEHPPLHSLLAAALVIALVVGFNALRASWAPTSADTLALILVSGISTGRSVCPRS